MSIEWNRVTWYSRLLAVIIFVGTGVLGFSIGRTYQKYNVVPVYQPNIFSPPHTLGVCMMDNGVNCSGCSVPGGDYNLCLAIVPEGEIRAVLSSDGSLTATLIARGRSGKATMMGAPFGFDRVIKDAQGNGYYVVATNRENDNPKSFDQVFFVSFAEGDASITPIISKSGFGGYSATQNAWYYVEIQEDYSKLTLRKFVFGSEGDPAEFSFGKLLVAQPGYDKESFITGAEVLSDGDLVLNFGKAGLGKGDIYARYVVSLEKKTVQTLR